MDHDINGRNAQSRTRILVGIVTMLKVVPLVEQLKWGTYLDDPLYGRLKILRAKA